MQAASGAAGGAAASWGRTPAPPSLLPGQPSSLLGKPGIQHGVGERWPGCCSLVAYVRWEEVLPLPLPQAPERAIAWPGCQRVNPLASYYM